MGVPVIPLEENTSSTQVITPYKKKGTNLKSVLLILLGVSLMGGMTQTLSGNRFNWVESDYHTFQGNYLGMYYKNGKAYMSVCNRNTVKGIEIPDGVHVRLPHAGGLVEVHYANERFPKVTQNRDVQPLYVPNPDEGYEETSTRYAQF